MEAARLTARTTLSRALRARRTPYFPRARIQSSPYATSSRQASVLSRSHIIAATAGGIVVGAALYLLSPGKSGDTHISEALKARKEEDAVLKYLKEFAYAYVAWLPGGRALVDGIFIEIEALKEKHRDEVNRIVKDAYLEFKDLSALGLSFETAARAYKILAQLTLRFGELADSALFEILNSHPAARDKFGGSADHLRELGEKFGPEAKSLVDRTWLEAKEILSNDVSAANLDKVRRLVEERIGEVRKLGDEVWRREMKAAQGYLDRNPFVKALVEKNANVLKQCNIMEVFELAEKAVWTGDTRRLEEYIKQATAKFGNVSLGTYFRMIPGGSNVLDKANQLVGVVEKSKNEGENLLRQTTEELEKLFGYKSEKGKDNSEKSKKDQK